MGGGPDCQRVVGWLVEGTAENWLGGQRAGKSGGSTGRAWERRRAAVADAEDWPSCGQAASDWRRTWRSYDEQSHAKASGPNDYGQWNSYLLSAPAFSWRWHSTHWLWTFSAEYSGWGQGGRPVCARTSVREHAPKSRGSVSGGAEGLRGKL